MRSQYVSILYERYKVSRSLVKYVIKIKTLVAQTPLSTSNWDCVTRGVQPSLGREALAETVQETRFVGTVRWTYR